MGIAAAAATSVCACPQHRLLTVLVPYAAGGSVDVTTRIVAASVERELGRTVVVSNAPGASGLLAIRRLLAAERDGCTLLAGTPNTVVLLPLMNREAGFAGTDLQPLGRIGGTDLVLVASASSGLQEMTDLRRAAAKASRPLRAGHPGNESLQAIALRVLQRKLHAELIEVPYSGAGQLVNDLVAGHLDIAVLAKPVALPLIQRSAIRLLSVLDAREGYAAGSWSGWFAAPGVSEAALSRTSAALAAAIRDRATVQALTELGLEVDGSDRETFEREVRHTAERLENGLARDTAPRTSVPASRVR